jgi:hypothetical protein
MNKKNELGIEYIIDVVCEYFNLDKLLFQSKSRKRELVQPRQIAHYFAKKYTKSSLAYIGKRIGVKDHATVLHSLKTVNGYLGYDKEFIAWVDDIDKILKKKYDEIVLYQISKQEIKETVKDQVFIYLLKNYPVKTRKEKIEVEL